MTSLPPPNVLWLTYEDTSPQFVSCYGQTPVVTTPAIDRLAADGVRFNNAFANAPVCSASRSAIITGCCNEATGLGHHRSKHPIPRDTLRGFPSYLAEAGYTTTNNVKTDYNIEDEQSYIDATWHESSRTAHWRNRPEGTPFFSVFNYADSHQSRTMTLPWGWYEENVLGQLPPDDIVSPDAVDMPPIYRDTPEMRKHFSRVYNSVKLCDLRMKKRLDELAADGLAEDTIVFCFADHGEGIPRGKCNGIGFGYRAAFVVYFPPKYAHLSPWGTQVATDELVSFEDLAPTMLSLAGVPIPEHMTGRALLGDQRTEPPEAIFAARNRLDDTPDLCRSAMDGRFVYTRVFMPHLPVVKYQKYGDVGDIQKAIRRDYADGKLNPVQAELVQPERPKEALYDLREDPWEIRNLADNPAYRHHLERLRALTFDHARDIRDVMFLPEREMVERAKPATPYERREDADYNPLADMLAVADTVGDGAAGLPTQFEALKDNRDAVRYWASIGVLAAREHLTAEQCETLRGYLDDPAPFVRVQIAAALYFAARDPAAKERLECLIQDEDGLLAHQAIEAVLYMPERAADFGDAVQRQYEFMQSEAAPSGPAAFPVRQALDMFRYLYQDQPLFYEGDRPYIDVDETRLSRSASGRRI